MTAQNPTCEAPVAGPDGFASHTIATPADETELEELLSRPTPGVLKTLERRNGDFIVLGVGGKMGPTLALMLKRGLDRIGSSARVFGVARFSDGALAQRLESASIIPIRCDLLDRSAVQALPEAPNVLFMAGQKFGTTGAPERTWAMNTLVPALAAEKYAGAAIVAFSTGNVYPPVSILQGGALETHPLEPPGEYANSCVGRERIFEYFSHLHGTAIALYRLSYAIDLRYGVLVDVAQRVLGGEPVDLTMGHANVIWQGDANAWAIQCLDHAASPAFVVNATGPEVVSVRALALRFGEIFGKTPGFSGTESGQFFYSNAGLAHRLFGYPTVSLDQMTLLVAGWLRRGGRTLNRPTHFETGDGRY